MELVRRLTPDERALIEGVHAETRARLEEGRAQEIYWLNLFLNRRHRVAFARQAELERWVLGLVRATYDDWPEVHVLSYGFIVNPAGATREQKFHCDYSYTSSNLFVPLTRVTLANAPHYLKRPLERARMNEIDIIGDIDDIMDAEGVDAIEVTQLVCRPFTLVRLLPDTPHRGIANSADHDRVMFWVTVDQQWHALKERTAFTLHDDPEYFADWQE